jgi:TRAP-type mannitol/chloroaromatic compound transport system permease large subunit
LLLAVGVIGTIVLVIVADQGSHSVSDTLYEALIPVVILWFALIAVFAVQTRLRR